MHTRFSKLREVRGGRVIVGPRPKAFLDPRCFALAMARFPEAEKRLLIKMICVGSYIYAEYDRNNYLIA